MSNTRTNGRGTQPPPGDAWELLRAAVSQASPPPAGNAEGKDGKPDRAERKELPPTAARLTWRAHGRVYVPVLWLAWMQGTAWLCWAVGGFAAGQVRELILTVAVLYATVHTARRAWWAGNHDGTKGRPKRTRTAKGAKIPPWPLSRAYLAWCLVLGTCWVAAAAQDYPGSGLMQVAWLAGGLAFAAPHMHRRRYRRLPAAVAELPAVAWQPLAEDPRIIKFRQWFCEKGALANAALTDFGTVPDGFTFELGLDEDSAGTRQAVVDQRQNIAARYDVPVEQVSVEHSRVRRSERRARLTILETVNAFEREQHWDGVSTYDPATGAFNLGRFIDSTDSHWMLHRPGSGGAGGVLAGVIGSGKSGTAHVIACEAGQARLCAECVDQRTCAQCDMRRIVALWMGDPQRQPFGVWRGHADLLGWGPAGCVRMLLMAHRAMRARAAYFGQMRWTDHQGRHNTGKGWFDPTPQFPLIYVLIDEWPLIVADEELGKYAVKLASEIAKEGRKVGVALVFITQIPDLTELGERAVREMLKAFNVLAHRTDPLSTYMLGVEGNPAELPSGVHGLGYINGMDRRPSATMRTKNIREYNKPGQTGVDVRDLAERISLDPIGYDAPVLDAISPLGYEGPLQILGSDGVALLPLAEAAAAAPALAGQVLAQPVPLLSGPASLDAVSRVARVLDRAGSDGADLFDVMEATELDALQAQRACSSLVASGHAAQAGDRFVPAVQEAR